MTNRGDDHIGYVAVKCFCAWQDAESVREYNLANHIILILGAQSSTALSRGAGLRNFLSPLRASSIRSEDIKIVIFCVNRRFIEPEWNTIASFPQLFVFAVRQRAPHSCFCHHRRYRSNAASIYSAYQLQSVFKSPSLMVRKRLKSYVQI